ncbi:LamG-like jellyroll fold domain-containing protein [Paenibacillus vandeheii]
MTVEPTYHWQFDERDGSVATDRINGIKGNFQRVSREGHGRIGKAVTIRGNESFINFGNVAGQFGTDDFTVAFGMKFNDRHGEDDLDIIGNRSVSGQGNWFSVRQLKTKILFEVDEDNKAKNYASAQTKDLLQHKKWHHIAIVREGRTIKIYIDGELAAEGSSPTGVANINNGTNLRLGDWKRGAAVAQYEDLRIYHTALNAEQVQSLVTPVNRQLRAGEIELVAVDDAAVILTQDAEDLTRLSPNFQRLRLGPNTGATLYKQANFDGVAQKLYADLSEIRFSKLADFPRSIRIWSAALQPFTGKWIIQAPNDQYLSLGKSSLTTAPRQSESELLRFHFNPRNEKPQLIPGSDEESASFVLTPGGEPVLLFAHYEDNDHAQFSIVNDAHNKWLRMSADNMFSWTDQQEERSLFASVVKMADHEGQVGTLSAGEAAFYEHRAYYGKAWILSDSATRLPGDFTSFQDFPGLDNKASSIRLGPDTGVTLFVNEDFKVKEANREKEIEDIVDNVQDLKESQIGNDTISAAKIFRTVAPEEVLTSYTATLSQDFRMAGDELEEFSSYRTMLKFAPGAGEVEISATDLVEIEVEGTAYEIDEERSVMLMPNVLNSIMITSEADGINTPGLKIRTSKMAANERIVIFPNREVHRQLAELEDDALWNAKDANGSLIVDQKTHSRADVASVQSTIKRVMANINYADEAPVGRGSKSSGIQSANRVVSSDAIPNPWMLNFEAAGSGTKPTNGKSAKAGSSSAAVRIREEEISQDDFKKMLSQAAESGTMTQSQVLLQAGRGLFARIKDAVKKAVSVVIGAAKKGFHLIVKSAEGLIEFVVDTAEQVGEFIEAVVERVIKGIKQFIQFLQFLFQWDDILKTQRYLMNSVNSAFEFAVQLAENAKQPVSDFVDSLQETVEENMNILVRTLGGEPSEARASRFELPEAAEWFLTKLLGGSRQSGASPVPAMGINMGGGSPLDQFFSTFTQGAEDRSDMLLRAFDGVKGAVEEMIANPLKPQGALVVMIQTIRDVVIQAMELVEDTALDFLDLVKEVVNLFQDLLTREIKIPFISKLLESIGAGKLTLLNLSSMLLAIPVTVVSKLAYNHRPFKDMATPNFSIQAAGSQVTVIDKSSALRLLENDESAPDSGDASDSEPSEESLIRSWGIVVLVADALNGLITTGLDAVSEKNDDPQEESGSFGLEVVTLLLSIFSWQANFITSDIPIRKGDDKENSELARSERILHYYRGAVLMLDSLVMYIGSTMEEKNMQRMKRREKQITVFFWVLSLVDAGMAIRYLAALPNKDKPGMEIANEVVSWLPNVLCLMRLSGPRGAAALAGVDFVATVVNTGIGGKLLANDLKDL